MGDPHGQRKTTTLVADLHMTGMGRADGPRRADQRWPVRSLCRPRVRARSQAATSSSWTTCPATSASVREFIEAAGGRLMFLPLYFPDFNPIGKAFARLEAVLRKADERIVSGLWSSSESWPTCSTCSSRRSAPNTSSRTATTHAG